MPIVFAQNKPCMIEREVLEALPQIGLECAGFYLFLVTQDFMIPGSALLALYELGLDDAAIKRHLTMLEHVGLITSLGRPPGIQHQQVEKNNPGYVYIVGGSGYYKIGLSATPKNRFYTLQTSAPFPLTLIKLIPTPSMVATEALLHTRFGKKRTKGEWFLLDQEDLDWIREQFPATTEEAR